MVKSEKKKRNGEGKSYYEESQGINKESKLDICVLIKQDRTLKK